MNSVQRILSYSDVPQDGLSGFAGLLRMALPQTPGRIQKVDPLIGVPIKYYLNPKPYFKGFGLVGGFGAECAGMEGAAILKTIEQPHNIGLGFKV